MMIAATKIMRCQIRDAGPLGTPLTADQTTLAVTPPSCRAPFFKTRLNTFPSFTPESRSQKSTTLADFPASIRAPAGERM
jgi:hypothetical protein